MKEIKLLLQPIDINVISMIKWGFQRLVVICTYREEADKLESKNEKVKDYFFSMKRMQDHVDQCSRMTWIECTCIPIHLWTRDIMRNIAAIWGELVVLHQETEHVKVIDQARLLILTSSGESIKKLSS